LVLFLIVTVICLFVLTKKFLSGQFCIHAASALPACGISEAKVIGNWGEHFKYASLPSAMSAHAYVYQGGVDYWPFWMPMIICVLWALAFIALGSFVLRRFKQS
jgi:hypothetical protein